MEPGFECSAACFVDLGPSQSLGYLLADHGYDVWIGSPRGSTFSRNHTHLDPNAEEFWHYSWNEMGTQDLPSLIDYILATTKHSKLNFIGHSQGTTEFIVMNAEKPEYNNKIICAILLAPAVFFERTPGNSIIKRLSTFAPIIGKLLESFKVFEMLPHYQPFSDEIDKNCSPNSTEKETCFNAIGTLFGDNQDMLQDVSKTST